MDGDCVNIASYQAAGVPNHVAEYMIGIGNDEVGPDNDNNVKDSISHEAKSLTRVGGAGLQWSNSENYNFYAVYPSNTQVEPYLPLSSDADYKGNYGLSVNETEASLVGYLPVDQTNPYTTTTSIIRPNMDYAYMTAKKADWTRPEGNIIDEEDEMIDLEFSSLVTALKITLKPGIIGYENAGSGNQIQISALTLFSESKKNICGNFSYDFNTPDGEPVDTVDTVESLDTEGTHSQVMMSFGEHVTFTHNGDESLTVTFFLLPRDYDVGDLKLRVHYYVGTTTQFMEATLGLDIPVCEMTYINNLKLKDLKGEVQGSAWFSALDKNVYVSQVSIPVASNVFASSEYFKGDAYTNLHQQVKKYTELWDMGVRGFEFVNRRAVTRRNSWSDQKNVDNTHSLANANFVVDENPLEGTGNNFATGVTTFGTAFETLATKLAQNKNETLVLVCTYQAVGDGYDPNGYVQQLLNYLDYFVANNTLGFKQTDFIQINSGTTAGNLKGNIAIIIRPGDDDRYETNSTTASITLKSSNDWSSYVTLIQDWGTAFDVWDRRYEDVARESTFETLYVIEKAKKRTEPLTMVEDWLCGISSSGTTYTQVSDANNFNDGKEWPTKKKQFNYAHTITGSTGTAYVQEWARVVRADIEPTYTEARTGYMQSVILDEIFVPVGHLWAKWPESITDKKTAIDGLFKMSVDEKGKAGEDLFINSLSGYYIDESVLNNNQKVSLLPFRSSFYGNRNTETNAANQGKGGNHVGLAYDLNQYVYGILTGTKEMESNGYLTEGPWGLVMMEHIGNTAGGADDKSVALVNLIMMNNFRFPLAQTPVVQGASVQKVPLSDESVDINKNIMVTWE